MRYLITGGNGFVGTSLVRQALADGRASTVVASVRPGRAGDVPAAVELATVAEIDGATDWSSAIEGVDVVIHTAARVHMMNETHPNAAQAYQSTNIDGTVRLAQQAARAGARRFVFLSSIKVNGDQTAPGCPFRPDDLPQPEGDYAESKLRAEEQLLQGDFGDMDVVVVRPPLVYGPGVKGNFRRMLRSLQRGMPLPLGGVKNRRTLVSLSNLTDLILTAASHPDAAGRVFLAGDGESLSTPELLRRAAAALGTRARLVPLPESLLRLGGAMVGRPDLVQRLCGSLEVDISAASEVMGWVPPFSVDEGLAETAASMKGELH